MKSEKEKAVVVNAATFKARRANIGMSAREFAAALGCSERAVHRWDKGEYSIPPFAIERMEELERSFRSSSDSIVEGVTSSLSDPCAVCLAYYRKRDHVEGVGTGIIGVENAAARDAAKRLEALGFSVTFDFPE